MKNTTYKIVGFLIAVFCINSTAVAQHVSEPGWYNLSNWPSFAQKRAFVLQGFPGTFGEDERAFVPIMPPPSETGNGDDGRVLVFSKATSGILHSHRNETSTKATSTTGYDTGLARVIWVGTSNDGQGATNKLLVCGYDTANSSVIKSVAFDGKAQLPNVAPTIILGPISGKTFCRAGIVAGYLYVFELQTMTFLRYQDTNSDGVFETQDTSWSMTISPNDPIAPKIPLFGEFRSSSEFAYAALVERGKYGLLINVGLDNDNGTVVIKDAGGDADPHYTALSSTRAPIAGLRELMVYGHVGDEFSLRREESPGVWVPISTAYTIPIAGKIVVGANQGVTFVNGERLLLHNHTTSERSSSPLIVKQGGRASVFEDRQGKFAYNQNTKVQFLGCGFLDNTTAKVLVDDVMHVCNVTLTTNNLIEVKLPQIGDQTAPKPYQDGKYASLYTYLPGETYPSDSYVIYIRYAKP